ncbi:MAG: hypothetical protein PHW46_03965 [Candidatus Omnitrophica bacterium]|nr:hypothetical protein [Candidatus Omnitrophota bacterium]
MPEAKVDAGTGVEDPTKRRIIARNGLSGKGPSYCRDLFLWLTEGEAQEIEQLNNGKLSNRRGYRKVQLRSDAPIANTLMFLAMVTPVIFPLPFEITCFTGILL